MSGAVRLLVPDQRLEFDAERPSNFGESKQAHVKFPALDSCDVAPIHAGSFGQNLLRHFLSISGVQKALSDSF